MTKLTLFSLTMLVLVGAAASAQAQLSTYTLTTVASIDTPIPGGTENFVDFSVPSVKNGVVAFRGDGNAGQKGIYVFANGALTRVADLNTPIPGGPGNFTFYNLSVDSQFSLASDGTVAFISKEGDRVGIYTNATGPLTTIVDANTFAPGSTGNFVNFFLLSYDAGEVAFTAVSDGYNQGLYKIKIDGGHVTIVADQSTVAPGLEPLTFNDFGLSSDAGVLSLSAGNIAFTADVDDPHSGHIRGVYAEIDGDLTVIADTVSDPLHGYARGVAISGKNVAMSSPYGIFVYESGGFRTVVDETTNIPKTLFQMNVFGPPSIDGSRVAFQGLYAIGFPYPLPDMVVFNGIYVSPQPSEALEKVVSRRLSIHDEGFFSAGHESLSGDSIAYRRERTINGVKNVEIILATRNVWSRSLKTQTSPK
jgi:hypothetical protein